MRRTGAKRRRRIDGTTHNLDEYGNENTRFINAEHLTAFLLLATVSYLHFLYLQIALQTTFRYT
jgi:hypothetical protein